MTCRIAHSRPTITHVVAVRAGSSRRHTAATAGGSCSRAPGHTLCRPRTACACSAQHGFMLGSGVWHIHRELKQNAEQHAPRWSCRSCPRGRSWGPRAPAGLAAAPQGPRRRSRHSRAPRTVGSAALPPGPAGQTCSRTPRRACQDPALLPAAQSRRLPPPHRPAAGTARSCMHEACRTCFVAPLRGRAPAVLGGQRFSGRAKATPVASPASCRLVPVRSAPTLGLMHHTKSMGQPCA